MTTNLKYVLREFLKVSLHITGIITFLYLVQYVKTNYALPLQEANTPSQLLNDKLETGSSSAALFKQGLTRSKMPGQ